jgi:serine/threonine protein phosphatase PrpC
MKPKHDSSATVTLASAQGDRSHQEDRAVHKWIETSAGSGWLLAVFDGHRGGVTAEQSALRVLPLFVERLTAHHGDAASALRDVFRSLNDLTRENVSGSTASVVFIPADAKVATLAVLGDSPIAILDARGNAHYGPDHNVRTNIRERAAAESRGGIYRSGYLEDIASPGVGLQMARSLGDADLSRVLDRMPEVDTVPLGGQGIVLVGTDGLLLYGGGTNSEQLRKILAIVQEGSEADKVVADALGRGTGDNVTAIVWRSKGNVSGE